MSDQAVLPRKINVTLYDPEQDKDYTHQVRKLPIGKSAELGAALKSIPAKIRKFQEDEQFMGMLEGQDLAQMEVVDAMNIFVEYLPEFLLAAQDTVVDILEVGAGLKRDTILDLGLDEVSDLVVAVFEVNNVQKIVDNAKNLQALLGIQGLRKKAGMDS